MNSASDKLPSHQTDGHEADSVDTRTPSTESESEPANASANSQHELEGTDKTNQLCNLKQNQNHFLDKYKIKMFVQYSREFLCIFALVLTTLATFQNRSPKVIKYLVPPPIFARDSYIDEWPNGNLNAVQNRVQHSELSLIFFYAPWSAESLFAKESYEEISQFYNKEAYFAAVNCWQPGGECRLYYSKVHRWPIVMAYLPRGLAVQYNGDWNFWSMSRFIDGLLKPLHRVHNEKDFNKLRINHDVVVLGLFKTVHDSKEYQIYFKSAVKYLEMDPNQNVKFAVCTGTGFGNFSVAEQPVLRIFNSNGVKEYNETKWSMDTIQVWVQKSSARESTWITLPHSKSSVLSSHFSKNPTLIVFSPRSTINSNNNDYLTVKQAAFMYRNCKNQTDDSLLRYIPEVRRENDNKMKQLYSFCSQNLPKEEPKPVKRCSLEGNKISDSISNTTIRKKRDESEIDVCTVNTCAEESKSYQPANFVDFKTPKAILKTLIAKECKKLFRLDRRQLISFAGVGTETENSNFESWRGMFDCRQNRSLSFYMLDSNLYSDLINKFTTETFTLPLALIVDNEQETTHVMKTPFSQSNILSFVQDFLKSSLAREQRSPRIEPLSPTVDGPNTIVIEEINSHRFSEVIQFRNKTVVVLFYTPQCALCNVMSLALLDVANIIPSQDINIFRIDGENNDLRWEYSMPKFPTLLIFPMNKTAETRVFPANMRINRQNVLGFILANMSKKEQLHALVNSCLIIKMNVPFMNCVKHLKHKISDEISNHLDLWRRFVKHRSRTYRNLMILKGIYDSLLRTNNVCDLKSVLKPIAMVSFNEYHHFRAK